MKNVNATSVAPDTGRDPKTLQASDEGVKHEPLTREDWIAAARQALIKDGIVGVSLRKLATSLGATTGAFYWKYKRLEDLLEDVRDDWVHRNTAQITQAIEGAGADGWHMYLAYTHALILQDGIDARYENAIREWAHSSGRTAEVLRRVEEFRIAQLRRMFEAMGFDGKAALIRARVVYFHQTGYNAMQIVESTEERLANVPFYAEVLTGRSDLQNLKTADGVRHFLEKKSQLPAPNTVQHLEASTTAYVTDYEKQPPI